MRCADISWRAGGEPVEQGADDAFARLAHTLNHMLDRIHELVGGIQA